MHLVYNYKKKNVEENITNGCKTGISKYWGMGFVKFGTKDSAAVKDTVNLDGMFNTDDVILLQRWLHADPKAKLADWKAADFNHDEIINIYDLCLMKQLLLKS
ncbi:MAG: dockerin type I repeat-containing protein [Oscillospiraceae bacterium]|nr:dockerin type I repeat-containing protein [Oscillospiraceae bacterium]